MSDITDKELLELAAKAAGISIRIYSGLVVDKGTDCVCVDKFGFKWNPLIDDGDALRLFVKLRMDVTFLEMDVFAFPSNGIEGCSELINVGDPYTATRRAIVGAAAEIGKAMP